MSEKIKAYEPVSARIWTVDKKRLKEKAAREGKTIAELLREWVYRYLDGTLN